MLRLSIKNGRRGIVSFNFIAMLPRIIFLVVMLVVCVVLIRMFISDRMQTRDIQAEILIDGLIYGPGGLSYYDPVNGRSYPGIIDIDQAQKANLDLALYFPKNMFIAAKIYVSKEKEDEENSWKFYYNREWYENWEPLVKLYVGGVVSYKRTLPVIYMKDSELKSGYVTYEVVQPKG